MTALTPTRPRGVPVARLTWLLARPGTQSPATLILPIVAFAVTTGLALTVIGGTGAFWRMEHEEGFLYQILSGLAVALLIVPIMTLGASAARLSARRRDDRLSTLRLLGATTATVARMTILESAALAGLGAIVGVGLYLLALPAVGLLPFAGAPLGAAALWTGVPVLLLVVAVIVAVAALSAAVSLRRVAISPLGVRTRQSAPRMHWARALIAVAVIAASAFVLSGLSAAAGIGGQLLFAVALLLPFAVSLAVLNLIGPWIIALVARGQLRRARTAPALIAARNILESPQAAWRQVSGLAMTSFVAVVAGSGISLVAQAEGTDDPLIGDIRTGILIVLIMSFLMVACSVGVNQAAVVLDRRELYVGLDRVGMDRETMESARRRTIAVPLITVVAGSALVGGVLVFPLLGMAVLIAPLSILTILVCFALGLVLVALALLASRPVLSAVLAHPEEAVAR